VGSHVADITTFRLVLRETAGEPRMIPLCSRFDSVLFTPKMSAIVSYGNFSRSPSIFLVEGDNQLTELRRSAYGSEDLFQKLLADHPAMLGIAAGTKGKLLLVRREQPVPDQTEGAERWSLDHLFLDQDGVPVLVKVKQASDTRARREVVAQMLDYAANGVAYWPIDRIVAAYRETVSATGRDPDDELSKFLDGVEAEAFWRQVESNPRSGRVRMLFVADRIPKELAVLSNS
jgi:hypothetical protein